MADGTRLGRSTTLPGRAGIAAATLLFTLAALAVSPWTGSQASARGLVTGFADFKYELPSRAHWLDLTEPTGGRIVRLNAVWRQVEPSKPAKPTDPNDPAYRFRNLDAAVEAATSRGFQVLLTVYDAPAWAQAGGGIKSAGEGAWKPKPGPLGDFAQALARRYSGGFGARDGTVLPKVKRFEVWNEPNQNVYLAPQFVHFQPYAPMLYRRLVNAFYKGAKKAQPHSRIVAGATSPYGDPPGGKRMHPAVFLRYFFCLNGKLKPTCHGKPHLDVLSGHPINSPFGGGGPAHRPSVKGDITVANFGLEGKILRGAERTKQVKPGGRHPLWATEFWWFSNPPNPAGSKPLKQAKRIEQTLYLLWKQGASVALNYSVADLPFSHDSFQGTGVYYPGGSPKPSLRAFRFPFVTHGAGHGKTGAWGKAPASGKLRIQKQKGGQWRTVKKLHVHNGQVFTAKLGKHAGGHLRATVGGATSLTWH